MQSALYLEHLLDSIDILPGELQKNFEKLRELNIKTKYLLQDADVVRKDLLYNINTLSKEEIKAKRSLLKKKFDLVNKIADEKIKHASKTYELVDKHIQRLDSDLTKFGIHRKEVATEVPNDQPSSKKRRKSTKDPSKKKKEEAPQTAVEAKPPNTEVLNMPVDPNEPTFCLCNQVSYGQMIGCDNTDCLIEWFHFTCVGLKTKPKGQWFCPDCIKDKKKK